MTLINTINAGGGALVVEATGGAERSASGAAERLTRARKGDRGAFESLYREHVGKIHAFCTRLTGGIAEAEEMTQEVFVRAWQHLDSIRSEDHLAAWLRHVALNLRRNHLRQFARRGATLEFEEDQHETDRDRHQESAGLKNDLDQAIATLPDGARDVLVLHDVYGFKHSEIADQLGLAVGTSKAQLHRARKKLRQRLVR